MKKAVIFDIDGVLAIKSPDRTYREYDKVGLDIPNKPVMELLDFYCNNTEYIIIFVTGRKEYSQDITLKWINNNAYSFCIVKEYKIFMRKNDDHRKAKFIKKEIYDNEIKDNYEVVAVFDDDHEVIEMYKKEGLFCFEIVR